MGNKSIAKSINFEKSVFDIKDGIMPRGAWWWWFWLFFIDNPENPSKPKQLMILWSSKKEKEISCNDLCVKLKKHSGKDNLDGVVAAWYFDGNNMNHNFLLEQCDLKISCNSIMSDSICSKMLALLGNYSLDFFLSRMGCCSQEL